MSLLTELPGIVKGSRKKYEKAKAGDFRVSDIFGRGGNILAFGDNAKFMKYLLKNRDLEGTIKLIYVDPPFFSKADYSASIKLESEAMDDIPTIRTSAYNDKWQEGMAEYLGNLTFRLMLMKDLLADDGCIWVHLDWHAVHYVKVIMDEVFGEKNFVNEIIWQYKSGGSGKRHFSRKHDTLLFYAKTGAYTLDPGTEKSYNRGFKPYRFKNVKEYKDELGWYTMVNVKDVWRIDMVGRTAGERTGYATQKPEALLTRIIESCTAEGDLCADFFCGSATMPAVCEKTGRKWIACDEGALAIAASQKRLSDADFTILTDDEKLRGKSGRLECAVDITAAGVSDSSIAEIKIIDYAPPMRSLPLGREMKDVVRDVKAKDPLQLIDFWSVDFSYDGAVHRPDKCFCKGKGVIETKCSRIIREQGSISIRAIDIFGNVTEKIVEL
ncbi:MAG: site-specific DNA-methyltransferase [Eubacteriaceae bacterium]|jgi:DNA modification methylase|nr:site-specific DNA-methyltransferase [Eubacteriaceae bacterium]